MGAALRAAHPFHRLVTTGAEDESTEDRLSRSPRGYHRSVLDELPIAWTPIECLTPVIEDRALELQRVLSERGHYRAPPWRTF